MLWKTILLKWNGAGCGGFSVWWLRSMCSFSPRWVPTWQAASANPVSAARQHAAARSAPPAVDKLARYYNVLVVLTVVDAMQIAGAWFMRAVEGYAVPTVPLFTLLGSLGMAGIEVKSIFEKGSDKERTDVGALLDLLESAADNEKLTKIINNLKNLKK